MKTELFKIESVNNTNDIESTAIILRNGGLVAIPTETVYGLAANALDGAAVKKIFEAKGRPQDNPLIVHISELSQLEPLVKSIPAIAIKLAEAFWPGPLTMIFKKSELIPDEVSCGLDTVAIRMPSHPIARAIISAAGVPLAAPSANTSGKPSPTAAQHVIHDMNGKIDAIVDGGKSEVGVESTVITLVSDTPRILRPGGVTKEMLETVLDKVDVDKAIFAELKSDERPASPGMKYKHYSPRCDVIIIKSSLASFREYVISQSGDIKTAAICFDGEEKEMPVECMTFGRSNHPEEQANQLFDVLRRFDETDVQRVFVRCPNGNDIGMAVMNRLLRAAAFNVVELPDTFYLHGDKSGSTASRLIGLTGPTGAGKTTVSLLLRERGYTVIDGDEAARKIVENGSSVLKALAARFGDDILDVNGALIRKKLAQKAFASRENTDALNRITHPAIADIVDSEFQKAAGRGESFVFVDAAALLESGIENKCSFIAVVTAPEKVRINRVLERDKISEDDVKRRMSAQHDESYYTSRADFIIKNYPPFEIETETDLLEERLKRL